MLENKINEQYSNYIASQATEGTKNYIKTQIWDLLANDIYTNYIEKSILPVLKDETGDEKLIKRRHFRFTVREMADALPNSTFNAVNQSLKYYKGDAAGFSKYLFHIFWTELLKVIRANREDFKYIASNLSDYERKTLRYIANIYDDLKYQPGMNKSIAVDKISYEMGLSPNKVIEYLNIIQQKLISNQIETSDGKVVYITDKAEISSNDDTSDLGKAKDPFDIVIAILDAFQTDYDEELELLAPNDIEKKHVLTAYSKFFTLDVLEAYGNSYLGDLLKISKKYSVVDTEILDTFQKDRSLPKKNKITAALGLKPITHEYTRFRDKVLKNHPELKELQE